VSRVPRALGPAALGPAALVVVAGGLFVVIWGQQYAGSVFVLSACYAIVTAGMAVQIGFSQQIAFSQSVFMGAGAYGVALLNTHFGWPVLACTPVVMAGSAVAALLLGAVVTRASGLALAVATLMLPLIAVGYVTSAQYLGGAVGQPMPGTLWPGSSAASVAVGGGLVVVAFLAVAVLVAARVLTSDIGLELFALGADERTAAAMGVRTPRRKLELFVLGCVFASLGGAAYAGTQQFVPETIVDPTAELALLIMLFIGGRRSIIGAVIGALVIQYLQGASTWVSVNILVVEGVLLTVVLLVDPEGLAGILATAVSWLPASRGAPPPKTPPLKGETPPSPRGATPRPSLRGATPRTPPSPGEPAKSAGRSIPQVLPPAGLGPLPRSKHGDGAGTPEPGATALLTVSKVGKEYGGLTVLDDVSLTLPARGLFGLCGPNGAGKSTLLNVIGGSVPPSRGRVALRGADITRKLPHQRFYLGVSRTFQAVHLIKGRTVLDNVAVSCLASHHSSIVTRIGRSRLAEARAKASKALDDLGLTAIKDREVSSLTLEAQRMVELARAMAPGPNLLLLDEPASGLSEDQRHSLAATLQQLGTRTCVLLVEHDLDLVAQVSERIFVLSEGRLVFDGDPATFRASPVVTSLLVGL
jgi:ABC-type branched-subunit amino acid transport system ATPase component/ABC-type branched-subunit amino acid transport system permease subunit